MPVTYTIDASRNLVHTVCRGETTLAEVLAHFDALENDRTRPRRPDVLLDLTGQTSLPDANQIRAAADRVALARRSIDYGACAIVAERPSLYGMIRVFQALTEPHFERSAVFRDRRAATNWLRMADEDWGPAVD